MGKAIIFGASKIQDYSFISHYIDSDDMIVCADGGFLHAKKLGLKPSLLIGDFDSYSYAGENIFDDIPVMRFDEKKDFTDTELAIKEVIKSGHKEIYLFGCLYGRIDQTIANVQILLKYAREGIKIKLIGEDDIVFVALGSVNIDSMPNYYFSIFSLSTVVENLSLQGTKYELNDFWLQNGDAIGVSNEFADKQARICFTKGELLIILSKREEN